MLSHSHYAGLYISRTTDNGSEVNARTLYSISLAASSHARLFRADSATPFGYDGERERGGRGEAKVESKKKKDRKHPRRETQQIISASNSRDGLNEQINKNRFAKLRAQTWQQTRERKKQKEKDVSAGIFDLRSVS